MLRTPLASERIQRVDPRTGIKVIQLTSYPTPSAHFLYDWPSVTPDNERVVFWSQRAAGREAPWDLYRCDTDGINLFQLTERGDRRERGGYYGRASSIMTLDGRTVYVIWGTTFASVDVETGGVEELLSLESVAPDDSTFGSISLDETNGILYANRSGPGNVTVRIDLASGDVGELELDGRFTGVVHGTDRIIAHRGTVIYDTEARADGVRGVVNVGDELSVWNLKSDGTDPQYVSPWIFAHATTLGLSGIVQGTGRFPHKCIWVAEAGKEPEKLVSGPYFWHSGASSDGEWIVSDTNWPDQGLQLIHVPSRNFTTLCQPNATQDHVEYGHPHPALSHDGRICVFRSDRTGMSQVYVAHVTHEFRERLSSGDVASGPKWF